MTRRARGFTLVEILVAIVILAIMTTLAYGAIANLRRAFEVSRDEEARIKEVELALHTLEVDWFSADPEPVRDALGERTLPAVQVDAREQAWFSLTHGSVGQSLGLNRGSQERVSYRLENHQLYRESSLLNAAQNALPQRRLLLGKVVRVDIKLDAGNGVWVKEWPSAAQTNPWVTNRLRPALVDVTVELEDLGTIHRLIEVAH